MRRRYFWERRRMYAWNGTHWHYMRQYRIVRETADLQHEVGWYDSKKKAKRAVAYYNRKEYERCPNI